MSVNSIIPFNKRIYFFSSVLVAPYQMQKNTKKHAKFNKLQVIDFN